MITRGEVPGQGFGDQEQFVPLERATMVAELDRKIGVAKQHAKAPGLDWENGLSPHTRETLLFLTAAAESVKTSDPAYRKWQRHILRPRFVFELSDVEREQVVQQLTNRTDATEETGVNVGQPFPWDYEPGEDELKAFPTRNIWNIGTGLGPEASIIARWCMLEDRAFLDMARALESPQVQKFIRRGLLP